MSFYEEVEIEDLTYDASTQTYTYPCPCGDNFIISLEELYDGEDVALCPSCTLRIKVIFEEEGLPELLDLEDEEEEEEASRAGKGEDAANNDNNADELEDAIAAVALDCPPSP